MYFADGGEGTIDDKDFDLVRGTALRVVRDLLGNGNSGSSANGISVHNVDLIVEVAVKLEHCICVLLRP